MAVDWPYLLKNKSPFEEILSDLEALTPKDFNLDNLEANGLKKLWILTDKLYKTGEPEKVIDALFRFIERLSRSEDINPAIDLGTPSPIVSTLEKYPGYEQYLIDSIKRYPTPLTVWMINRILNVTNDISKRENWLKLLKSVNDHPLATSLAKEEAQDFLEYQFKKDAQS